MRNVEARSVLRVLVGVVVGGLACGISLGRPVAQAQARAGSAQTTGATAFTSAVVKRSDVLGAGQKPIRASGRSTWRGAALGSMVRYAYDVSGPTTEGKIPPEPSYDVDATFAASATPRDVRDMLKRLLVERFALRARTEV